MTMPGAHSRLKLFLRATTHLRAGATDQSVDAFSNHYQPAMERQGAHLSGIWERSPLNGTWPEITTIWEIISYQHFAKLAAAHHRDVQTRPTFQRWMGLMAELVSGGHGLLVNGDPGIKTVAQRKDEKFRTTVCIQEVMTPKPGRQHDYIKQLECTYIPWLERTGKTRLASFTTVFAYNKVTQYWAREGGWDVFANYHPSWGATPDPDIESWMQLAPALRERWDGSFLQSLPPSPLG